MPFNVWASLLGGLLFIAVGAAAIAMLTVPADPLAWLAVAEGVVLVTMLVNLLLALVLPRRRLQPVPARATGLTVLLVLLGLTAALSALAANLVLFAAAGVLGAASVVVLRLRAG